MDIGGEIFVVGCGVGGYGRFVGALSEFLRRIQAFTDFHGTDDVPFAVRSVERLS